MSIDEVLAALRKMSADLDAFAAAFDRVALERDDLKRRLREVHKWHCTPFNCALDGGPECADFYANGGQSRAEPEQVQCRNCVGGRWETECCNGSGGCSCRGERIDMGMCNVCHGTGWHAPDANTRANCDAIAGRCFIGSGPTSGYWAGK